MQYADIHFIDEQLTMRRDPIWAEAYPFTLDACIGMDGDNLSLHAVSEFSFCIMGDWIPVPRGLRRTWFAYLVYGDRERLLKHLKTPWRKAC